ncbi:bifunctional indole-3-glycerol-phosphate synthase TrpC/phosphoribosylanthranilate isomerase TrpF [Actinomyces sp. B33]|nr:bifunctional indole-3-glycerol-phosphate synthase TrpC/phosphoribosylanthranilate isomerase TrpF [Actinomyces sp. B33]MDC4233984.1 bifunctional indole-3-glycerol-phosphate synthase TrpC/phosphoribosylanthranilate isomerase TrpF [Actinomyces sp. B33]
MPRDQRRASAPPTVLDEIVARRRTHLPAIDRRLAGVDLDALPRSQRSLADALRTGPSRFIMECKSASPSLGVIRPHYEPGVLARAYSRHASAISVLCEPERFGGDYDHLQTVALSTHLPVLCKDFIIDPVQVRAARYFGADAILLMMSVLDDDEYARLAGLADSLGMDVLTEAGTEEEVARAAALGAGIIGINNRDLHDLSIDLGRTERLAGLVPDDAVVVSESGIRTARVVRALAAHADAFLVGSQLSGQDDVDLAVRRLVFGDNKVCGLTSRSAAQAARAAGAVYGGLVFEESSPRRVSPGEAARIIAHEPGLRYVAVSRRTSGFAGLALPGVHAVQLHAPHQGGPGAELALVEAARAELARAGASCEVWRAVSMTRPDGPATALALHGRVDRLVLDAGDGGSATSFDWSTIPADVAPSCLLAGGVSPDNLPDALRVGTAGVDLNSGVEREPGVKDTALIARAFDVIRRHHD